MASVTAGSSFSEDQFGKKVDRCITDTLVKAGTFNNKIDNSNFFHLLCKTSNEINHIQSYFSL